MLEMNGYILGKEGRAIVRRRALHVAELSAFSQNMKIYPSPTKSHEFGWLDCTQLYWDNG